MNSTRTFTARYPIFLDDAIIAQASHQITATGYGAALTFELDGQPATAEQVMNVRQLAEARGSFERVSGPEMLPIGKTVACRLHKDMAGLGLGRHYQIAGEALGYPVSTLAALTRQEAQDVWSYICALAERPTLPSVLFNGKAGAVW